MKESINFIQVLPLEPQPESTITYSVYPQYDEPKRICGNCKHWERGENDFGMCLEISKDNDIAYVIGNYANDGILRTKSDFGCVLWKAKESKAKGE